MTNFSYSVITVLLGWLKSICSQLWYAITGTGSGGFVGWMVNHWFVIAVILCLVGLLADLVVYVFRWRPDIVFRSHIERRRHPLREADTQADECFFEDDEASDAEQYVNQPDDIPLSGDEAPQTEAMQYEDEPGPAEQESMAMPDHIDLPTDDTVFKTSPVDDFDDPATGSTKRHLSSRARRLTRKLLDAAFEYHPDEDTRLATYRPTMHTNRMDTFRAPVFPEPSTEKEQPNQPS